MSSCATDSVDSSFPTCVAQIGACVADVPEPSMGLTVDKDMAMIPKTSCPSLPPDGSAYIDKTLLKDRVPRRFVLDDDECDVTSIAFDQTINATDRASIEALHEYMASHHPKVTLSDATIGPGGDFKLTRFLRDTDHVVETTAARLIDLIEWRRTWCVDQLRTRHFSDEKYAKFTQSCFLYPTAPNGLAGLSMEQTNGEECAPAKPELLYEYHMSVLCRIEMMDRLMAHSLTRLCGIQDIEWYQSVSNPSPSDYIIDEVVKKYYPQRFVLTIVIHPTSLFHAQYNVFNEQYNNEKRRLYVVQSDKTSIVKLFSPETVPPCYGGTLAEPDRISDIVTNVVEREMPPAPASLPGPRALFQHLLECMDDGSTHLTTVLKHGPAHKMVTPDRWMRVHLDLTEDALLVSEKPNAFMPIQMIHLSWVEVYPHGGRVARRWTMTVANMERDFLIAFDSAKEHAEWMEAVKGVAEKHEQQDSFV